MPRIIFVGWAVVWLFGCNGSYKPVARYPGRVGPPYPIQPIPILMAPKPIGQQAPKITPVV